MDAMSKNIIEDEKPAPGAAQEGDIRMIYKQPLYEKEPEAEAELIRLIIDDQYMQYWKVVFLEDNFPAERWIRKRDKSID
jgi:hypothetical protein